MTLALQDPAIVQTTPSLTGNLFLKQFIISQVLNFKLYIQKVCNTYRPRFIAGKPDAFDRGLVECQVTPDRLRRYFSDVSYLSLEELTTQGTRILQSEK
jgi:hypothetical protein